MEGAAGDGLTASAVADQPCRRDRMKIAEPPVRRRMGGDGAAGCGHCRLRLPQNIGSDCDQERSEAAQPASPAARNRSDAESLMRTSTSAGTRPNRARPPRRLRLQCGEPGRSRDILSRRPFCRPPPEQGGFVKRNLSHRFDRPVAGSTMSRRIPSAFLRARCWAWDQHHRAPALHPPRETQDAARGPD